MRNMVEAYAYKIISEKTDQLTGLWEEYPELTEEELAEVEARVQALSDAFHVIAEAHGYYEIKEERETQNES